MKPLRKSLKKAAETGLRKGLKRFAATGLAIVAMWMTAGLTGAGAASMHREKANPQIGMEAEIGYGGVMTYGKPMPIRVRIRNDGADLEGVLGVNAYINKRQYDRYEREVSLPAGSEKEFVLPVQADARQEQWTVELTRSGSSASAAGTAREEDVLCAVTVKAAETVNPAAMMIGVLSTRPANLRCLDIGQENDVLMRYEFWTTVALTPENFPTERRMLDAFGMVVIDDVDPALLSEAQQQALDSWLQAGHILLCGGGSYAGVNVRYFSALTGLSAGTVGFSNGIAAALEEALGRVPAGQSVSAAVADIRGDDPLCTDEQGRGILFRSAAGEGRIYTMAFEAGDPVLCAGVLSQPFWQELLVRLDATIYNAGLYYRTAYTPGIVNVNLPIDVQSPYPVAVATAAGALVLSGILWLILKKVNRRGWLWLGLPVIALAAAGTIAIMAKNSEMNRPMMVAATNLIQSREGPTRRYTGIQLAAPEAGRHRVSAGEGMKPGESMDYYYYGEQEENKITEPTELRTCFTEGAQQAIDVNLTRPWDMVALTVEEEADTGGRIEAAIWMEEDGLHGEITNHTSLRMKEGYVLTSFGFAKTAALSPGETVPFSLKRTPVQDPSNISYEEGCMYASQATGMYSVIYSLVWGKDGWSYSESEEDLQKNALSLMLNGAADQMVQTGSVISGGGEQKTQFLYAASPESIQLPEVRVDGKAVDRKTEMTFLSARIDYQPVGRTGMVFYPAGLLSPERCAVDGDGKPGEVIRDGGNRGFYPLGDLPTFRFQIPDRDRIGIESLTVSFDSYLVSYMKGYALNARTGEWEEFRINAEMNNPEAYLDDEGWMYLQFRPASADRSNEIPAPSLTMEGRQLSNAAR